MKTCHTRLMMESGVLIETPRLVLREILFTDVAGMLGLDSDLVAHSFWGDEPVMDKEQIVEVIDFIRWQYADNGVGRWAVVNKVTNRFMGWAGLKLVEETINGHTGYVLHVFD